MSIYFGDGTLGGYWYVTYYASDKARILAGPLPLAHNFAMEVKEHLFFILLLVSTTIPFLVFLNNPAGNKKVRNLIMVAAAIVFVLGLTMEGSGALIGLGVKLDLLKGVK